MAENRPTFYGGLFRFARFFVRLKLGKFTVQGAENLRTPAIYISRHQNMHGPVHSMVYSPVPLHIWSMYMFLDRVSCRDHFRDFTFSARYGWPRRKASLVAGLIARPVSAALRSMQAIPVYRGQRDILKTFDLSLEVLMKGENLVIFPDIRYDDTSSEAGAFYTGYLHLARTYYKKTGRQLPIIPMYATHGTRQIVFGEPLLMDPALPFHDEKDRVSRELQEALDRLVRQWDTEK